MRRYRAVPAVVFAIVVSALVGGFFGRSALATDDKVPDITRRFTRRARARSRRTTSTGSNPTASSTAPIRGMLGTLDPHSSFFDPKEYAQMRERQEGRYYGLGIQIQSASTATSSRPASSKGRRPTRRASAAATSSRTSAARTPRAGRPSRRCRSCAGRRARRSTSSVRRRGYEQLIPLDVTRDEVYIPTVPAYVHDRRDDRLHPAAGFRREHRPRCQARRCAICRRRA